MNLNKNMGWVYAKSVIEKEMEMKREGCLRNILVELIRRECEYKQIQFDMEVRAGASTKVVALQAAREFKATWIVLDRSIKKDAKYFKENLVCFISKVTRNNKIKILRGNISGDAKTGNGFFAEVRTRNSVRSDSLVESRESPASAVFKNIYEETPIPVEERPEDLFSLEINPADQIKFAKDYYKQKLPLASNIIQQADSNQDPPSSAETFYFSDEGSKNGDIVGDTAKVKTVVENFISNLKLLEGSFVSPADPCSICQYKSSLMLGQELIKYTYAELEAATNNFSEENCLSRSGSRPVYKGRLNQGLYIAVKDHKHANYVQQRAEFESEVEGISRAQHKNLVMLLGYCSEDNHRFLVYEYICNGSLYSHLYGSNRKVLDWEERRKIAIGAARGIRYLHEECRGRQIVHGDLRLKKILLTHNLEPMVGDFGLAYK
ncbi:inactive protein kinase SELMODRAFT_444075 [Cryptomeria japonica]|uniref:inactive protein kinase SELMODRAFT_444075 n=1 Tax=Cryptomeria japonica TaxID=3369 RepID=UPI0025ABC5C0|nr:inactive protein kinase SELMODRAFT_444075 [Cryptomeria japonica]